MGDAPGQEAALAAARVIAEGRGYAVVRSGEAQWSYVGPPELAFVLEDDGFFDPWWGFVPVDPGAVRVRDASELRAMASYEAVEVAARMVLIDPTPDALAAYGGALNTVTDAQPRWVADKVRWDLRSELSGRGSFLAVFALGMLTTLVSTAASLEHLVRSRRRDTGIAWAWGSSPGQVALRWLAFVWTVWGLPALFFSGVGLWGVNRSLVPTFLPWMVLGVGVVVGGLVWWATRRSMADVGLEAMRDHEA